MEKKGKTELNKAKTSSKRKEKKNSKWKFEIKNSLFEIIGENLRNENKTKFCQILSILKQLFSIVREKYLGMKIQNRILKNKMNK